jgi:hypothetical protein
VHALFCGNEIPVIWIGIQTSERLLDGFTRFPLLIGQIHQPLVRVVCCYRSIVGLDPFPGIVLATRCFVGLHQYLTVRIQERTIGGYGMMHGMTVDRIFVERGVTGAKPIGQRPEGAKLLAMLQPGDVVIAAKLDRLFRSALDALEVQLSS